jgi:uncharacterized membrane protein
VSADVQQPAAAAEGAPPRARTANSALLAAAVLVAGTVVFLWYAPDSYNVYKALHVIAVVVWVGGDVTLTTLGIVFERRRDGEALAQLGKLGAWIGVHVYTPALFAVLGFGIALMQKVGYPWDVFWVDFALVGWAIAAVVGVGFVGPELGRIDRAAREHGPDSEAVRRRVQRLFTIFRFDTALLILIVIDMTAKPSF